MGEDHGNSITNKRRANALPPPPKEALCEVLNVDSLQVEWLAGDGSDRCYYRISSDECKDTFVLMQLSGRDAEALKGNDYEWISIGKILSDHGIAVPQPVATLPDYAALITEDYGDSMLEQEVYRLSNERAWAQIESLYRECFESIATMLGIEGREGDVWTRRSFDNEKYQWELEFFDEQFCQSVCGIHLGPSDRRSFSKDVTAISEFLASHSKFFVHRDFHSRNVMVKDSTLALIDFQDARFGNAAYDLISLVYDNYLPFDSKVRANLLSLALDGTLSEFRNDIDPILGATLLQRQLKAIGTYGYLTKNKKRGDYLQYVQPALATLAGANDPRWPFISGGLLEIIAAEFSYDEQ